MEAGHFVIAVIKALDAAEVPYMVVRALSANVYSWCDQHGTHALLDEIRASVPEI